MKKLLLIVALFAIGFSTPCLAQKTDEEMYQEYLQKSREREMQKQRLIDYQSGHHFGIVRSSSLLTQLLGVNSAKNAGTLLFYGNRLSEHWMLAVMAGVDIVSPSEIYNDELTQNNVIYKRTKASFPVIGEARFYFGSSRFMPYLYTDLGTSFSKDYGSGLIWNTGLGSDINFKKSHTIFISFGIGTSPIMGVNSYWDEGYTGEIVEKKQLSTFNFKLGYYF